jgi:quercetin dioxygenase-like cupin family protein
MTTRDLLPLYAVGAVTPDEAAQVERDIAAESVLAAELDGFLAMVAVTPSPDVKARLLASVGGGRFERFADRISTLFDVSVDRARELLALVERAASWEHPIPGVSLIHFKGGPAYANADCGFVRIAAGCKFPWHTHRGEEVNLILVGHARDAEGKVFGPGDEIVEQQGSAHDLTAGEEDVLYVARAMNGIEVSGLPL